MILPSEAIRRRINRVQALIGYLERLPRVDLAAYRKDIALQLRLERVVQLITQSLVDVGQSILERKREMESPPDVAPEPVADPMSASFAAALAAASVAPEDLTRRLGDWPELADVLVHENVEIDPQVVWDVWQRRLADFDALTSAFAAYVAKYKGHFRT
jgi:uncharacterized protein YutE (UPF0331/DUF86 family)